MVIEAPVTLPIGHGAAHFEMLCKMICPGRPRLHRYTAEPARRSYLWSLHFPGAQL